MMKIVTTNAPEFDFTANSETTVHISSAGTIVSDEIASLLDLRFGGLVKIKEAKAKDIAEKETTIKESKVKDTPVEDVPVEDSI